MGIVHEFTGDGHDVSYYERSAYAMSEPQFHIVHRPSTDVVDMNRVVVYTDEQLVRLTLRDFAAFIAVLLSFLFVGQIANVTARYDLGIVMVPILLAMAIGVGLTTHTMSKVVFDR